MAYYSVAMLAVAATLAERDPVYDDMVVKFLEQLVLVMDALEASGCYDPEVGFFYDLLTEPSGITEPVEVQTLVGVIPALPAITLPLLTGEDDMPLGVQLVGAPGDDARLLRTAQWLVTKLVGA
jgi:Asp-tRNA(Asn)/Glu-tRNA(Gln) amidotransferase A subunit family amidase